MQIKVLLNLNKNSCLLSFIYIYYLLFNLFSLFLCTYLVLHFNKYCLLFIFINISYLVNNEITFHLNKQHRKICINKNL